MKFTDIYANKNIDFHNYVINIHNFNPTPTYGLQYHVMMKFENELKPMKKYLCFLRFTKFQMKKKKKIKLLAKMIENAFFLTQFDE